MRSPLIGVAALAALFCGTAHATEIGFTYTGVGTDNLQGVVQLEGTEISPNMFQITSGTDTVTGGSGLGGAFNLLLNPNGTSISYTPSGYFYYDNLVMTDGVAHLVDDAGLLFTNGSQEVNLFAPGNSDPYTHYDNTGFNEAVTLSNIDVPEPAAIALLGVGLIGLGLVRRRQGWLNACA